MDALALIITVVVTAASVTDNAIGIRLLDQVAAHAPTVTLTLVDAGFKQDVAVHDAVAGIDIGVVTRSDTTSGFVPVRKRWIVEQVYDALILHATAVLDELGVTDRCEVIAGDFRTGLPPDGDVYLLSAVVHSWSDDESTRLIRNCLAHGDRVLVVDEVLSDAGLSTLLKDLQLMVFSGGRLRSVEEYGGLFSRAGARLLRRQEIRPGEQLFEGGV